MKIIYLVPFFRSNTIYKKVLIIISLICVGCGTLPTASTHFTDKNIKSIEIFEMKSTHSQYNETITRLVSNYLTEQGYDVTIGNSLRENVYMADDYYEKIKSNVNADAALILSVAVKTLDFYTDYNNENNKYELLCCFNLMWYSYDTKTDKRLLIGLYLDIMDKFECRFRSFIIGMNDMYQVKYLKDQEFTNKKTNEKSYLRRKNDKVILVTSESLIERYKDETEGFIKQHIPSFFKNIPNSSS